MQPTQISFKNEVAKICAFTGHRELDESFSLEKLREIVQTLVERGICTFFCGMAKGFDLFAAEEVIFQKQKNPQIKLVACVPYYGQEKGYMEADKKRYVQLLKACDLKMTFSEKYYKGCTLVRDRFMADQADVLVAYLKKDTGGTAYTVKYFQKKHKDREIIFLNDR